MPTISLKEKSKPEWRHKPKTRTGARYGKSNSYDVPASKPLVCTGLHINLFPAWALSGILIPENRIIGMRSVVGSFNSEDKNSNNYSHSNARHPNDPICKTTH